jgi:hypothetical protein
MKTAEREINRAIYAFELLQWNGFNVSEVVGPPSITQESQEEQEVGAASVDQ